MVRLLRATATHIHFRSTRKVPFVQSEVLRAAAVQNLLSQIHNGRTVGSVCLFSLRHDFPSEWAKFQNTSGFSLVLTPELYPYWAQGIVDSNHQRKNVEFFAEMVNGAATLS